MIVNSRLGLPSWLRLVACFLLGMSCFQEYVLANPDAGALNFNVVLDHRTQLTMEWSAREDDLIIQLQAATTSGYLAVGFSPNGGMKDADIILGWVDQNNEAKILDMYGVGNTAPMVDESQDVEVVSGHRNDTHTTIRFKRPLDTCDDNDFTFVGDTVRVIYATGPESPDPERKVFPYHMQNRGVRSMHIEEPIELPQQFPQDVNHWDFRAPNVSVPVDLDTLYWCNIFKMPKLNEKQHFIGYTPLVIDEYKAIVHHMILYECLADNTEELFEKWVDHAGHQCYSPNMPDSWQKCENPLIAWAIGSEGAMLPDHVGTPLGEEHNGATYFLLQVHYDNPNNLDNIVDQSGVRMYHTPKLRKHNAGLLMLGVNVTPFHIIAPMMEQWNNVGVCHSDCMGLGLPSDGIKVLGGIVHGHLRTRGISLRHIRDGKELPPIIEDNHYDFNFQQDRSLSEERTVLPGDTLLVNCTTSSARILVPTFGGLGTLEEMCLTYVMYYPRTKMTRCLSTSRSDELLNSLDVELYRPKARPRKAMDVNSIVEEIQNDVKAGENAKSITFSNMLKMFKIKKPFLLQNMTLHELLHERSLWRNSKIMDQMRDFAIKGPYNPVCALRRGPGEGTDEKVLPTKKFPEYEPYVAPPTNKCGGPAEDKDGSKEDKGSQNKDGGAGQKDGLKENSTQIDDKEMPASSRNPKLQQGMS